MATLASEGRLITAARPPSRQRLSTTLYGLRSSYAEIYRAQPAVRTVVNAIARNVAQLGTHVFEATPDDDRQRVRTGPLAATIRRPNPGLTRYSWIFGVVADLGIFDQHTSVKVRGRDGRITLWPIPAEFVEPIGKNWMAPDGFRIGGSQGVELRADQVFHIHGYSPTARWSGVPPMETLRRILGGDQAAEEYREAFWRNGAQLGGVIKRPLEAPQWSDTARSRFRDQWKARYSGDGSEPGGTPLLEDGMDYVQLGQTNRNSQYLESRKLTREEVAALYHLPLVYAGLMDSANYAVVKEARGMLYSDCLGPIITQLQEEIDAQLVAEFDQTGATYVEFNWMAKLAGSFEEQAAVLSTAVGRPWLTTNEARARMNLSRLDDPSADEVITPMNVTVGGQPSPQTPTEVPQAGPKALPPAAMKAADGTVVVGLPAKAVERFETELVRALTRQLEDVYAKAARLPEGVSERWDEELAADLHAAALVVAEGVAAKVLVAAGRDASEATAEPMRAYLRVKAAAEARAFNRATKEALRAAGDDIAPAEVFDGRLAATAEAAVGIAVGVAQFAAVDTGKAVGFTRKTWRVTSARSRHPELNGVTVGIDDVFPNGARWPGDGTAGVDEVAGCRCELELSLEG